MNFRMISQTCLPSFTPVVTLAADVDHLLSALLSTLKLQYAVSADYLARNTPFSKYPPFLPSIYLFNLKQTKLFAFIIN